MSTPTKSLTCEGGCHCGAVRFQVVIDRYTVEDCNCSIDLQKRLFTFDCPARKFYVTTGAR